MTRHPMLCWLAILCYWLYNSILLRLLCRHDCYIILLCYDLAWHANTSWHDWSHLAMIHFHILVCYARYHLYYACYAILLSMRCYPMPAMLTLCHVSYAIILLHSRYAAMIDMLCWYARLILAIIVLAMQSYVMIFCLLCSAQYHLRANEYNMLVIHITLYMRVCYQLLFNAIIVICLLCLCDAY